MREDTIYDLFFASLSGIASPDQQARLVKVLDNDEKVQQEYVNYVLLFTRLYRREGANISLNTEHDDYQVENLILDLCRQEQKASPVEIEKPDNENPTEKVDELPLVTSETNRFFRIYNLIVSVAAVFMFLFIIYAELFPPDYSIPVASVIDQVDVKWNSTSERLQNNDRVLTNQPPFQLDKGIVKLSYDEGIEVLIEGPSRFTIEKKGIDLAYGRLYSFVSKSGRGFTIDTPNSRFVDLGTEFGIFVDDNSSSELHVIKGEVQYFSGLPGSAKASKVIRQNNARRFDSQTGEIQTIPISNENFARHFNSDTGMVWRGQESLSLADIIAGKNGLENAGDARGISPSEGIYVSAKYNKRVKTSNKYHVFESSEFIDGVFIPDGGDGLVTISSENHTFACPDTSGEFTQNLCVFKGGIERKNSKISPVIFDSQKIEENPEEFIFLHSNCGITINLKAVNDSIPNHTVCNFKAHGGITEFVKGLSGRAADIDLWIIVDGNVKYEKQLFKVNDGTINFDIQLTSQNHFLTLIVTDGLRDTDTNASKKQAWANDFFYFVNPELTLKPVYNN